MSITKMIEDKCKDGVNFYKLDEIVEFLNGKGHEKNISENGKYIVVNSKFISTDGEVKKFSNEQICPLYKDNVLMVMSDLPNGRALAKCFYVEEDNRYTLNQRICALKVKDKTLLSPRFLYYYLNRNKQLLRFDNGVDQTNLKKDDILNVRVAVPPLEVQDEIVHVLDDFMLLSAELSAELKARRSQYEYYRNHLIKETNKTEYKDLTLQDILKIKNGKDYKHLRKGKYPVYGTGGIMTYVDEFIYDKPSVLIPRKGSLDKLYYVEEPFWNVDTIFYTEINEDEVIPKYVYYYLQNEHLEKLNIAGGIPSLTQTTLNKVKIKIPSKEVQEKIINVLDNFDKICSDFNIGIPGEMDARKKQFEFYRNLLLTFPERGETIIKQASKQ